MDDKLFADLLASTEEAVAIEQGRRPAAALREYELPDVKALRSRLHLKQDELACALGVSKSLVQSWEQNRRFPDGAPLKLLRLLEKQPALLQELQVV